MTPADVADEWDFYPCRVDDAPASVLMNFWYKNNKPPGNIDTLYYLGLQIMDAGPHGMGVDAEAQALYAVEDGIESEATKLGFYYVGRLRNDGDWQLTFYGEPDKEEALKEVFLNNLDNPERGYRLGSNADAEWSYYHEFLLPDAERASWMASRRVVAQLEESGDNLDKKRKVDHCIHFSSAADRDVFAAAVRAKGFEIVDPSEDDGTGLEIHRVESIQLDDIHDTVMELTELAAEHKGDYDGWGTTVERDE